jgi:hypothetical protein
MEATATSNRECNCGSAECRKTKLETEANADPVALTAAGLCEKTQSAQWLRAEPEGAKSSCRWTACA